MCFWVTSVVRYSVGVYRAHLVCISKTWMSSYVWCFNISHIPVRRGIKPLRYKRSCEALGYPTIIGGIDGRVVLWLKGFLSIRRPGFDSPHGYTMCEARNSPKWNTHSLTHALELGSINVTRKKVKGDWSLKKTNLFVVFAHFRFYWYYLSIINIWPTCQPYCERMWWSSLVDQCFMQKTSTLHALREYPTRTNTFATLPRYRRIFPIKSN